jgi:hypothetical protein
VHSLVALAFLGPCPEGLECCHWDGDPGNNRPGNLRWDTSSANLLDRQRHGTDWQRNKVRCPWGHVLAAPNLVRAVSAAGRRSCLACTRAHAAKSKARKRGDMLFDFQVAADDHFRRIMAAA